MKKEMKEGREKGERRKGRRTFFITGKLNFMFNRKSGNFQEPAGGRKEKSSEKKKL